MSQIKLIEEGNDEDFGADEYDFVARPKSAQAAELQRKFRAEAQARFVRLADDLTEAFPTAESVNEALRRVLGEIKNAA